jgi:hypothetical protein
MTTLELTAPELVLVAATRGMLGAGLGLLIADKLSAEQRRTAGRILFGIGLVSTLPLAFQVFSKRNGTRRLSSANRPVSADR